MDTSSYDNPITKYEEEQIELINKWKNEEPSVLNRTFGVVLKPVYWAVEKVIPEKAIQGLLDGANEVGRIFADTNDIIRDGKVQKIEDLKYMDLKLSDQLSDEVHNWAIGLATTEGGITGFFGLPGALVDVPTIITFALRTIHKIGLCYGYDCKNEDDKKFVLGILAASGANSVEEKTAAILALKSVQNTIAKQTWKKMAETAAQQPLGREAAILAVKNLAKQLGVNITKRKALQAIPIIGALVGASSNGWYIKDVGWAARRAFQERWLMENGKIIDMVI
ncbi:EcsC family protein [Fredinandcohnia sp. QZ13]|uniref:EcsC family protein n=1 Tax=Fredinandcohnia sp. QZ13 TaxID=3073144 RepID=UPI0028536D3F|nr:EcsC family protein [Fredinandcohnia sp. QZ13]MDR4886296.1 EcsC family protein [Fredinandcohnia sp. QZ13]